MCGEYWTYLKLDILMHLELEKLEQKEKISIKLRSLGEQSNFLFISVFLSDIEQLLNVA